MFFEEYFPIALILLSIDEILYSDLIIHVRDISHEDFHSQNEDVLSIIREIFGYDKNQIPENYIEVINKVDKINLGTKKVINSKNKIYLSALTGIGISNLKNTIKKLI